MGRGRGKFNQLFNSLLKQLDNLLLMLAAAVFVAASVMGFSTREYLGPVVVALLGLLAFSQLKSRSQVQKVADTWHRERTGIFLTDFPGEYSDAQKIVSRSYFYTGETMGRTMPIMANHFPRIFANGGSVKILLPNPNNSQLMEAIAKTRIDKKAKDIKASIEH